jgi:simple sugar transport system permease protein
MILPSWLRVIGRREFGPILGLAVLAIVFNVMSGGNFLDPQELASATSIAAAVGTIGVGVAFLMISGEFDLSVSAVYALTPVVMAKALSANGWNEWSAFGVAIVVAAGVGLINGLITTRFNIPSFIATLGTLFGITGLLFVWTGGYPLPYAAPGKLNLLLGGPIGHTPFSAPVGWMLFWMLVVWYVLERTRYGNWTYAAGGRAGVARAMGIPVRNVKLGNFVLCSLLAGFAGCTQYAQLGIVSSGFGENYNLIAIVAAVLGGTSLYGVIGSIPGTVVGALILGVLETGLVLIGAPSSWYTAFIGLILIVAVIANARLGRFKFRGRTG